MKDRDMSLRDLGGTTALAPGARRGRLGGGWIGLALLAMLGLVRPSWAQPKPVEPYYIVVTQDQAPLLAGAIETHYRVALLRAGQVLRVDFEQDNWALAAYPSEMPAYVRATEVTASPDGSVVRTNEPTRLRAANMESTGSGSWQSLLLDPLQPLPPGTELRVLGVDTRADGVAQYYRVAAPPQAHGFLKSGTFRRATAQETQDYLNRLELERTAAPAGPAEGTSTATPASSLPSSDAPASNRVPAASGAPSPTAPPAPTPGGAPAAPSGAGSVDTSLLAAPAVPAVTDQPAGSAPPPVVIDQSGSLSGGTPPATAGAGTDAASPAVPTAEPVVLTLDALESAFDEIRSQPVKEAEYEELIARFEAVINTLGESRDDQRLRHGLQARLDLLRLRMDYRDSLRALDAGIRDAQAVAQRAAERIDWLRAQGGYAVIGRLVPSSIYDGSNGPLMYRVVAVNTDTPRTLAYVRMDDQFTLPTLVGKIVGVRGQVTLEPSVGTRIVQAESVDEVSVQN